MQSKLVETSLKSACLRYRIKEAIFHSNRGSQYTSKDFRKLLSKKKIKQSMSYTKSSCYGNAKCESLFGRFKVEAIYSRYKTETMPMEAVKALVFRYFMSYWNNRRISSSIGGIPPMELRKQYFQKQKEHSEIQKAA